MELMLKENKLNYFYPMIIIFQINNYCFQITRMTELSLEILKQLSGVYMDIQQWHWCVFSAKPIFNSIYTIKFYFIISLCNIELMNKIIFLMLILNMFILYIPTAQIFSLLYILPNNLGYY